VKGILARTAIALSPLVIVAGLAGAASASTTPDSGISEYITHYSDYLTNENGTQATGNPVTFHNFGGHPNGDAVWDVVIINKVTATWPFTGAGSFLCTGSGELCGDEVVEIMWSAALAAGTTNDLQVVLRPKTDGNYWVEHPLSGGTYELINVHASNDDGGAICLADSASDTQASLQLCPDNGTMTLTPS